LPFFCSTTTKSFSTVAREAFILDGLKIAQEIDEEIRSEFNRLRSVSDVIPRLEVLLVGDRPDSRSYVRKKEESLRKLGFLGGVTHLSDQVTLEELEARIRDLNLSPEVHGILLQLPLPPHLHPHEQRLVELISAEKDVDGFHSSDLCRLSMNWQPIRRTDAAEGVS
jgi:methylenetetrahydrofolate dehydrogenase (NADP+)/methenyltetrahydrofolate cyclohydrolase